MARCTWCDGEMVSALSCVVDAVYRNGRRFEMIPFGEEGGQRWRADRCGDCGVLRGGWHHPGCDVQQCPDCRRQLISSGCPLEADEPNHGQPSAEPSGVDGNGLLTERMSFGGQEVIIHHDEVPESDITTLRGIRLTTALRTVIDVAPDVPAAHLEEMVRDCLERRLFTVEEALRRIAQPDMVGRRGAELLRRVLPPLAA